MSSKFFTNEEENTLINTIKGVFEYKNVHFFDALVAYIWVVCNFDERQRNVEAFLTRI